MTDIDFASRVAKGVEWLNSELPDWELEIDLDTLRMNDAYNCIIGQLFGLYGKHGQDDKWSEEHGFYITSTTVDALARAGEYFSDACDRLYDGLQNAWLNYFNK